MLCIRRSEISKSNCNLAGEWRSEAEENLRWGYRRIVGDLMMLGIRIGTTTVKKVLRGNGIHPAPDKAFKKPAVPWTTFVHAHMDSMVGCDFFTKRIYTLRDPKLLHVLWLGVTRLHPFCVVATLSYREATQGRRDEERSPR